MSIKDKVAIVTGGANGIGKAISLALAKEGAKVVINYNTSDTKARALMKEIHDLGGIASIFQADVSSFEEASKLMAFTIDTYQELNILVNNAGITDDGLILRMQEAQFDRVLSTNLKGVWNMCKHGAKPLLKSGYGRIINISSVSGLMGNAGQSNYSAAKAGVIGLTKALAREFASKGLTVNAIAPGFIVSEMTEKLNAEIKDYWLNQIPLKRFGKPEDVAHAVLFLASPEAGYMTGHTLEVDGGLAI